MVVRGQRDAARWLVSTITTRRNRRLEISATFSMRRAIHYCVEFHEFLYSRTLIVTDASIVRSPHRSAQVLRKLRGVTSQIARHHTICSCCGDLESRRGVLRRPRRSRFRRVVAPLWRPPTPDIRVAVAHRPSRRASRFRSHPRRHGRDLAIRAWHVLHIRHFERRHVAGAARTS
jgi:hypothetical protein